MPTISRLKTGEVILNVDHSVGKFGRNRRADVQLVQLLLNSVIDTTKHTGPISNPPLPAPEPLKLDGICGPKTIAAILWVQKSSNSGGGSTFGEDATVNRVEANHVGPFPGGKLHIIWEIQSILGIRDALPRSVADIPAQPLASELAKEFSKGLVLRP